MDFHTHTDIIKYIWDDNTRGIFQVNVLEFTISKIITKFKIAYLTEYVHTSHPHTPH